MQKTKPKKKTFLETHTAMRPHSLYLELCSMAGVNSISPMEITSEQLARLSGKIPTKTVHRCWWHHESFDGPPLCMPMSFDPLVVMPSVFCSFPCMLAFAHDRSKSDARFKTQNVYKLAMMMGIPPTFSMADPWWDREVYGGMLSDDVYMKKSVCENLEAISRMPPFTVMPLLTMDTWKSVTDGVRTSKHPPSWFEKIDRTKKATSVNLDSWTVSGLKVPSVEETVERLASKPEVVAKNPRYKQYLEAIMEDPEETPESKEIAKKLLDEKRPDGIPSKHRDLNPVVVDKIREAIPRVADMSGCAKTIEEALQ